MSTTETTTTTQHAHIKVGLVVTLDRFETDPALMEALRRPSRWMTIDGLPGVEEHHNGRPATRRHGDPGRREASQGPERRAP